MTRGESHAIPQPTAIPATTSETKCRPPTTLAAGIRSPPARIAHRHRGRAAISTPTSANAAMECPDGKDASLATKPNR